jgi:hypothetical protein
MEEDVPCWDLQRPSSDQLVRLRSGTELDTFRHSEGEHIERVPCGLITAVWRDQVPWWTSCHDVWCPTSCGL